MTNPNFPSGEPAELASQVVGRFLKDPHALIDALSEYWPAGIARLMERVEAGGGTAAALKAGFLIGQAFERRISTERVR